ncbi:MAG: WecB/TagA/CpsF family glycosyltransferase [Cycloclasticus sp.]
MERTKIITMDVDVTTLPLAVDRVLQLADINQGAYVCVANVHMCMESFDSASFCSVVNKADLVIPDGKPLSIAQKLLGHEGASQVRGQDIMNALCAASGEKSLNIGFYGGSSDAILDLVKSNLLGEYSDIKISYSFSPPFRPLNDAEDADVIFEINDAEVDVLFVGIGCPKQEIWMAEHKEKLSCVMLGVGAAFDFIAGNKKHAPRWVQNMGLEWLFRLCSEPGRLWKRYLKQNPRFVWYFMQQWLLKRNFN